MTLALALEATSVHPCEPISTVPYTITQSGTYCLDRDLWSPGTAITIHASDVTLELMGVEPVAVSIVYGVCSGNVAQGFATLGGPQ